MLCCWFLLFVFHSPYTLSLSLHTLYTSISLGQTQTSLITFTLFSSYHSPLTTSIIIRYVCFFFRMCTFGDFFTPIPLFSSYYPSPGTSIKYSKFLTIKFVCLFGFFFFFFSLLVLSFPWHHKLCDPIIIYLFLCFIFSLSFVAF